MADNTPTTTRQEGRAIFALIDCETDETIVLFHQWNNGDLTVTTSNAKAFVKEHDQSRFKFANGEGAGGSPDLPPDDGRRRGRGRRP